MKKSAAIVLFLILGVSTAYADQGNKMGCVDQHGSVFPIGGQNNVDDVVYKCELTFLLRSDKKNVNGYAVVNQAAWVITKK